MIWAVRIRPPTTIITILIHRPENSLEAFCMVKDMDGFRSYVKEELAGRAADGELFDGYEDTVDTLFDGRTQIPAWSGPSRKMG